MWFKNNKKEELDTTFVKNDLFKNYNGRLFIYYPITGLQINLLADNDLFDGNIINFLNSECFIKINKLTFYKSIQLFIMENKNLSEQEVSLKFIKEIDSFINNCGNENYNIVLTNEDYYLNNDFKFNLLNLKILKDFEIYMREKILNSNKKFLINNEISKDNPFVKNNEKDVFLLRNLTNTFYNVHICYYVKSYLTEELYKEFIDNKYAISIMKSYAMKEKEYQKYKIYCQMLAKIFYLNITEIFSDNKIYYLLYDKPLIKFDYFPIAKFNNLQSI